MGLSNLDLLPVARILLAVFLHFVWQATLVVVIVAVVRAMIQPRKAQLRYIVSVSGLVALLSLPILTLSYYIIYPDAIIAMVPAEPSLALAPGVGGPPVEGFWGWWEVKFQSIFSWFDQYRSLWLGSWLAGFILLFVRLSISQWYCHRLRSYHQPLPPKLRAIADRLAQKLELSQHVIIGTSREITQAMATGLIRPMVLIPAAWVTQLPLTAVEAVLAHELAHIKRWDLWVNVCQRFTETVFFFHPLVWWLSQKISYEREICCDQRAILLTGQPMRYVETLAHVAGSKQLKNPQFQLSTSFNGDKKMNILRRAKLILEPTTVHGQSPFRALITVICVGLIASFGSYAYSSMATATVAGMQDQDELHVEIEAVQEGDVFRVRRHSNGADEDVIVVRVDDEKHEAADHDKLHLHLTELLHQTEAGAVSQKELAKKLRQMADHLEASHDKAHDSGKKRRRKVQVQDRILHLERHGSPHKRRAIVVDPQHAHDVELREIIVDPRQNIVVDRVMDGRNIVIDGRVDLDKNIVLEVMPHAEGKAHSSHKDHDILLLRADVKTPGKVEIVEERIRHNRQGKQRMDQEVIELHRADGGAKLSGRVIEKENVLLEQRSTELDEMLRELRHEVQQLRREVKRLKSDRNKTRIEDDHAKVVDATNVQRHDFWVEAKTNVSDVKDVRLRWDVDATVDREVEENGKENTNSFWLFEQKSGDGKK